MTKSFRRFAPIRGYCRYSRSWTDQNSRDCFAKYERTPSTRTRNQSTIVGEHRRVQRAVRASLDPSSVVRTSSSATADWSSGAPLFLDSIIYFYISFSSSHCLCQSCGNSPLILSFSSIVVYLLLLQTPASFSSDLRVFLWFACIIFLSYYVFLWLTLIGFAPAIHWFTRTRNHCCWHRRPATRAKC